jgi:hypothetical protein
MKDVGKIYMAKMRRRSDRPGGQPEDAMAIAKRKQSGLTNSQQRRMPQDENDQDSEDDNGGGGQKGKNGPKSPPGPPQQPSAPLPGVPAPVPDSPNIQTSVLVPAPPPSKSTETSIATRDTSLSLEQTTSIIYSQYSVSSEAVTAEPIASQASFTTVKSLAGTSAPGSQARVTTVVLTAQSKTSIPAFTLSFTLSPDSSIYTSTLTIVSESSSSAQRIPTVSDTTGRIGNGNASQVTKALLISLGALGQSALHCQTFVF